MILIRPRNFQECIVLSRRIPEFDSPYDVIEYEKRYAEDHISLTALAGEKPAGFKIGYDRFKDGSFYSWMGGVLPQYRKQGVASSLANTFVEAIIAALLEAYAVRPSFPSIAALDEIFIIFPNF